MKKYCLPFIFYFIFYFLSCTNDQDFKNIVINLDESQGRPSHTYIDDFIKNNFNIPYNIEIKYKWDDNEFDQNKVLVPVDTAFVVPILRALKAVWLDNYAKLGGEVFMKQVAPKLIVLSGGRNYNSSGTITRASAEAARKITFFQANEYEPGGAVIKKYFHTMQHEFSHILHQTKLFATDRYTKITPGAYRSDWQNLDDNEALKLGLITPYAAANYFEDFAELVSTMLTNSQVEYEAILDGINSKSDEPKEQIKQKEEIIVDYYKKEWDIDFYELRDSVHKYTQQVLGN